MNKAILNRDDPMNANKVGQMESTHWANSKGDTALISIVDERKATRSKAQNDLYWAWLRVLSDHTGYEDLEELRRLLQKKFLGMEHDFWNQARTEHITEVKGTSKLTVKQFRDFLEKVEIFSRNELSCKLPNHEPRYWQAMGVTS
jgi:hypothetical protein|tara:strand:- start:145 stop:579 length:435 start_codon:yes stop_codon:yes gene_type:complete